MTKNITFVTTAIDYPNAYPHIGTAFEKIGADVYARFRRFQGRDVYFSMGNDENTVKVKKVVDVLQENITYKQYVDKMAFSFKEMWRILDISFDDFIQTSEDRHLKGVQLFLNTVYTAGYIEKKSYKAMYCEGCEEFKTPKSMVRVPGYYGNRCPNHPNMKPVEREEENYFFSLSKFKNRILEQLKAEPEVRYNEVKKFVESELDDISISRKNEGWGIPIPWDNSQVTYVWFDALLNYLTVIGFGTDFEKFEKYWPAEIHFVGKDITRFHSALFPAMCMAYNEGCQQLEQKKIELPKRVFSHGFVYQKKGNQLIKASKSDNAINPLELINKFGSDAYRYYFLSKINFDSDGEYSLEHFTEVYNSDLANSLGNLVSRTIGMAMQYFDGKLNIQQNNAKIIWLDSISLNEYERLIVDRCSYRFALELIWRIIFQANQHIEQTKPWDLAKNDKVACRDVLLELIGCLRITSILLKPFMPKVAEKIYNSFQWGRNWNELSWEFLEKLANENFSNMENGIEINRHVLNEQGKYSPLFPRIK